MSSLVEISEFADTIIRLDVNTLVKGYDGDGIGPANQQAQILANRTVWLKTLLEQVKSIQDNAPDPNKILAEHVNSEDPHPQYLTEEKGKEYFVDKTLGNQPNGYLQLDERGFFPSSLAKLYEARYVISADETDRLALEANKNITICLQRDNNTVYYLNPDIDPAVKENWLEGEETTLNLVPSVFGRIGEIVASDGDYTTDQITETSKRKFVSSTEKEAWNAKQTALVSGSSIKTLFNNTVLGEGNIGLEDIIGFNKYVNKGIIAEDDIEIAFDDAKQKTIIRRKNGSSQSKPLSIIDINVTQPNTVYKYDTEKRLNFDYYALVSKRSTISKEVTETVDYIKDNPTLITNELPNSDNRGYFYNGDIFPVHLNAIDGNVEKALSDELTIELLPENTTTIDITVENKDTNLIPTFTSQTTLNGYTPFSSAVYSDYNPWKAFAAPLTAEERVKIPRNKYWSDNQYWYARTKEVYIGIKNTNPIYITGYRFQNFEIFGWETTSTPPTGWILQGRNEDADKWINLDTQENQTIIKAGDTWSDYILSTPAFYKQYRFLVTGVVNTSARTCISRIQFYEALGLLLKNNDNNTYYTVTSDGAIETVTVTDKQSFNANQFFKTPVVVKISDLEDKLPLSLCSLDEVDANITSYKITRSIAIHNPVIDRLELDGLDDMSLSDDDKRSFKVAVSPDGQYYYIWKEEAWEVIGSYVGDDASAESLYEKGMSLDDFNAVPHDGWMTFNSIMADAQITLAASISISSTHDLRMPSDATIHFSDIYGWEKMSTDKVRIILSEKTISFIPTEIGVYRLCYRFN